MSNAEAVEAAAELLRDISGWPMTDCRWTARKMFAHAARKLDRSQLAAAALISLARHNIPPDVQELLVQGDANRGVPPGALTDAISAMIPKVGEVV